MNNVLLITPLFTQFSSPYAAFPFLSGTLNYFGIPNKQVDLGLLTVLELFSKNGLRKVFDEISRLKIKKDNSITQFISQKDSYINTIEDVILFLQGKCELLSYRINSRKFLPENRRFEILEEINIKNIGMTESAKFLATLYIDDIVDLLKKTILPDFNLSSYYEKLAVSANSFDSIYNAVNSKEDLISLFMYGILERLSFENTNLVCITIPFPGNLYSALKIGKWIKTKHPKIKIAIGGGYVSTELKFLKEKRIFEFVDFISLDSGEKPILSIVDYIDGKIQKEKLSRTYIIDDCFVKFIDNCERNDITGDELGIPNYRDLPLDKYLTFYETTNKMHRLWSTKIFLKLRAAYGCYHANCTFCDTSLDYIKNYKPMNVDFVIEQIRKIINDTGIRNFHFVDEAMPPNFAKYFAIALITNNINIVWWSNIRFDKAYTQDLCKLLSLSGCIAVTGGLETANDRILKLMDKRINVSDSIRVLNNFSSAGIMVHTYLIYGFPGETINEAVNSLEIIRQLFKSNIVHSAYYHRFALTIHSEVYKKPEKYGLKIDGKIYDFANNDVTFEDYNNTNIDLIGESLHKALYNFNYNNLLNNDIKEWFDVKKITISVDRNFVKNIIAEKKQNYNGYLLWIGDPPFIYKELLIIPKSFENFEYELPKPLMEWIIDFIGKVDIKKNKKIEKIQLKDIEKTFPIIEESFNDFLNNDLWLDIVECGLIFVNL